MSSSSPPLTLNAVHDHLETSPNLLFPTPSSNPRKDTLETSPNVLSSPPQTILPHPSPIKPLSPASILSLQPTLNTPSVPSPIFQWNTPNITSDPIPSQSAPARSFFATLATSDHSALTHSSPSWQAARDSVLSQMITSQDLAVAATLPKARYKTGGRRGRGGRNPVVKPEGPDSVAIGLNQSYPTDGIESGRGHGRGRGRGRGGRPRLHNTGAPGRAIKRKRGQSEDEGRADKDDSDESETITPLPTQSRSGRRIFKATNFTPVVIDLEANSGTQAPLENTMRKTPGGGKRGRKPHRKPGEASVCKNCGRGHSPRGNMIVFCDGCNTPWHQYCHDPTITVEVVQIEEKEWFCGNCEVIREEKVQLEGRVSAEGMSLLEVRDLDSILSGSSLSLILQLTAWLLLHLRNAAICKPFLHLTLSPFCYTLRLFIQNCRFSPAHILR